MFALRWCKHHIKAECGAQRRNRTADTGIFKTCEAPSAFEQRLVILALSQIRQRSARPETGQMASKHSGRTGGAPERGVRLRLAFEAPRVPRDI